MGNTKEEEIIHEMADHFKEQHVEHLNGKIKMETTEGTQQFLKQLSLLQQGQVDEGSAKKINIKKKKAATLESVTSALEKLIHTPVHAKVLKNAWTSQYIKRLSQQRNITIQHEYLKALLISSKWNKGIALWVSFKGLKGVQQKHQDTYTLNEFSTLAASLYLLYLYSGKSDANVITNLLNQGLSLQQSIHDAKQANIFYKSMWYVLRLVNRLGLVKNMDPKQIDAIVRMSKTLGNHQHCAWKGWRNDKKVNALYPFLIECVKMIKKGNFDGYMNDSFFALVIPEVIVALRYDASSFAILFDYFYQHATSQLLRQHQSQNAKLNHLAILWQMVRASAYIQYDHADVVHRRLTVLLDALWSHMQPLAKPHFLMNYMCPFLEEHAHNHSTNLAATILKHKTTIALDLAQFQQVASRQPHMVHVLRQRYSGQSMFEKANFKFPKLQRAVPK